MQEGALGLVVERMQPGGTEEVLRDLNRDQVRAVTHGEGALLIVAGAGTGKTTVITRRIAYLVTSKLAEPGQILAMTFTEKAASEMEERVDLLVPYGYTDVAISTFHAFGDRLLREHALELGLTPDFRVLSQAEQIIFFREHLFELPLTKFRPLGDPTKHLEAIVTLISRAKDEDESPQDYIACAERFAERAGLELGNEELREQAERQMELARTYAKYEELKSLEGKIDFGDQVGLVLKLLREHPVVLEKVRARFRYILVDEFQDTNYAQFELVKLLAARHRNLTVVADDDQAVYKFRGAAISNVLGFTEAFPDCEQIVLTENYRSTQVVLDTARRLILHNNPERLEVRNQIDKRLHAQVAGGFPVEHLHFDTVSSEADAVAKIIAEKVGAGEARYRDFAILVRSNNDADPFLRAMNVREIPHWFSGSQGLYRRHEVKDLIAFLHVIADPEDSLSLYQLAASEVYGLDPLELTFFNNVAHRRHRSLYNILKNLEAIGPADEVRPEGREKVARILSDIEQYVRLSIARPTGEVLYQFIITSGILAGLTREGGLSSDEKRKNDEKLRNVAKFFQQVRSTCEVLREDRVSEFVRMLDLLREAGEDPAVAEASRDVDAVNVLTVHKAKGLEFPIVFMVSLAGRKFPWPHRHDPIELPDELVREVIPSGDTHLQEERRVFYVGMTRAMRGLYFTSARDYGTKRQWKVSQFVLEALDLPKADMAAITPGAGETIGQFVPEEESSAGAGQPIPDGELLNTSPLQIDDYLTCPLKYKYVHVLRVPILQHHSVVYGNAVHRAVAEFERRRIEGRSITDEELISVFEASWVSEGFLTREHEEQRLEAGREALRRFRRAEEASGLIPTHVEKEFSFVWHNNRVSGRWDRVDQRDGEVVIIDFKTSEIRAQEEATRRARESLQLSIYALAYREKFGRIPDRLELHFLETGLVGAVTKSGSDLEETGAVILGVARGMRARDFTANPGYMQCSYCAYRDICPSAYK